MVIQLTGVLLQQIDSYAHPTWWRKTVPETSVGGDLSPLVSQWSVSGQSAVSGQQRDNRTPLGDMYVKANM